MAVLQVSNLVVNEIFPSTKTKTINKLITENSLTRLINRLLDVDGYVITSEFSDDFTVNQIKDNVDDYVILTDDELEKDCEFSIRGYYFNIGKYSDILDNTIYSSITTLPSNPSEPLSIIASIYVSKDTEYPELYGQEIYSSETVYKGTSQSEDAIVLSDNASLETVNINSFQFFHDNDVVTMTVTGIDESHHILDGNGDPIVWGSTINKVKYVIAVYNSALYLSNSITEIESEANQNPSLPQIANYTRYDLEILRLLNKGGSRVAVIPLSSLHRFDTLAISNIDGGVIIEEN